MMFRIPTDRPVNFRPLEIVHVILTVDKKNLFSSDADSFEVKFDAHSTTMKLDSSYSDDEEEVRRFAEGRARVGNIPELYLGNLFKFEKGVSDSFSFHANTSKSPFDIVIYNQCWIVLELEAAITNWQFAKGEHGVSTKAASERNCYLRHVYRNGADRPGAPISEDGSRVLYFGVVARDGKGTPGASELFNFHTEFLTRDIANGEITKRLNVIFDPDIKNEGTKIP